MKLLKAKTGDRFKYRNQEYTLIGVDFEGSVYKLDTDRERLFITEDGLNDINFINMEQQNKYLEKPVESASSIISTSAGELTNIMMDNIKKLQTDPSFISQADAINSQVKTMIDIARAQIEMYKAMKG